MNDGRLDRSCSDFFSVIETQSAVRRFRADPVPDHDLARMLEAATRAPSARGAEPWYFVVVRDQELRSAIATSYREAWLASERLAADADRDLRARPHYAPMMRAARALALDLTAAPVVVACCLDHRQLGPIVGPAGELRAPAAAYGSIFPAVQNLLLAARALGLGTTLTTLHRAFEPRLKALLAIPDGVEVAALVPVGYPARAFPTTRRKSLAEVAFVDRFGRSFP